MSNLTQSEIEMDAPINVNVPVYQPHVIMPHYPRSVKSCPLIGFGITLLILSLASIGLGGWAVSFSVKPYFAYASLGCSCFFLLTSIMAIYGGGDIAGRKCSIITSLVLGILGVLAGVVGIATTLLAIVWYQNNCDLCDWKINLEKGAFSINCSVECYEAYLPVHVGLAVLTVLEALVGLILSCSACCNSCSCCCCYKDPYSPGFLVQPAPMGAIIHTSTVPPPYERLQETDGTEFYRPSAYNNQGYNPNFNKAM